MEASPLCCSVRTRLSGSGRAFSMVKRREPLDV
jgi:hypothetical protein